MSHPAYLTADVLASTALSHAVSLPAELYTDAAIAQWEHRNIFATSWQFTALASELKSQGDYVARDTAVAPTLAVQAESGLRTFYNVCRHRAGPVALGSGNCPLLRCRYHGWVYNLEGALQHAPELGNIEAFDRSDYHLRTLENAVAGDLVFVRAKPPRGYSHDIRNTMGAIEQRLGGREFHQYRYYTRTSYEIACNWKVYVDNYLEGYHIPQVHPGLAKILDYREYQTQVFDGYSLQHSEIKGTGGAYKKGDAFYYYLFPNMMLNILPGRLQTNVVVPLSTGRCRVDFVYYYPCEDSSERDEFIAADLEMGDEVQQEDITICEHVQKGLASGAYDRGRLSVARESGVHHWQECYRRVCRDQLNN